MSREIRTTEFFRVDAIELARVEGDHSAKDAVVHPEKDVAILQRAQAMSDNEGGTTGRKSLDRLHYHRFGIRIDGTRRLIEDENGPVFEESASKSDALAFSTRETHAAFAHHGLIAVRQTGDELVDICGLCCFHDIVLRGARPGLGNGFRN